jgi:drug/metabolite transporter (DMT)-like permease
MPASAFALTLIAAALHAAWNLLLGGARDVRAATTVTLALSVVLFAPVAVATWRVEASAVPWIVASAALELAYFFLLVAAYSRSDVSLVYPIARGTAPVLVLALAATVGATVGLGKPWARPRRSQVILVRGVRRPADGRGVPRCDRRHHRVLPLVDKEDRHAAAVPYLLLVLAPVAFLAVVLELKSGRLGILRVALRRRWVAASLASFGAYALVLAALALAPAASVAAVRESSILFVAALGALVLREPVGRDGLVGAVLVVLGVILVATA